MINLEEIKTKFDGPIPENNEQWFELRAKILELCDFAESSKELEAIHATILSLCANLQKELSKYLYIETFTFSFK